MLFFNSVTEPVQRHEPGQIDAAGGDRSLTDSAVTASVSGGDGNVCGKKKTADIIQLIGAADTIDRQIDALDVGSAHDHAAAEFYAEIQDHFE